MRLRRLTHVVLLSALAAGCSQSLFDDGSGNGDGTPPDADPSQPPAPDARDGIPDADPMAPDAGRVIPDDGGVPRDASGECPGQCIQDDAFEDFDALQGGSNGRWRYVEVQSDNSYVDMTPATVNGFPAFLGMGTPQPSLVYCAATTESPCRELPELLALTTTASGAFHPALMWTAPQTGIYSVDVNFSVASGSPQSLTTILLALNSQLNSLDSETLLLPNGTLFAEVSLAEDEVIVLSAIAEEEEGGLPVGVNVLINGPL